MWVNMTTSDWFGIQTSNCIFDDFQINKSQFRFSSFNKQSDMFKETFKIKYSEEVLTSLFSLFSFTKWFSNEQKDIYDDDDDAWLLPRRRRKLYPPTTTPCTLNTKGDIGRSGVVNLFNIRCWDFIGVPPTLRGLPKRLGKLRRVAVTTSVSLPSSSSINDDSSE